MTAQKDRISRAIAVCGLLLSCCGYGQAQSAAVSSSSEAQQAELGMLPNAPMAQDQNQTGQGQTGQDQANQHPQDQDEQNKAGDKNTPPGSVESTTKEQRVGPPPYQTKRILGVIPNFRAVSADVKLPPQAPKEKIKTALQDSFDYSSFIFTGVQAGIAQGTNSYPAFHQGAAGYGRYYWHTFADTVDENLWVEGLLPSAFHEDSRYYTLGHGNIVKRAGYAFTRTLVTRSDDGGRTPNFSEVGGAGIASAISSAYYPGEYRTWTKVGQRWLTSVIIDGGTFVAKEFWPDINAAVFHQKQ